MDVENIAAQRGGGEKPAALLVACACLHPAVKEVACPGIPVEVDGELVEVDIDLEVECGGRRFRGGVILLREGVDLTPEEVEAAVDEARRDGRHLVALRPSSIGDAQRGRATTFMRQLALLPFVSTGEAMFAQDEAA